MLIQSSKKFRAAANPHEGLGRKTPPAINSFVRADNVQWTTIGEKSKPIGSTDDVVELSQGMETIQNTPSFRAAFQVTGKVGERAKTESEVREEEWASKDPVQIGVTTLLASSAVLAPLGMGLGLLSKTASGSPSPIPFFVGIAASVGLAAYAVAKRNDFHEQVVADVLAKSPRVDIIEDLTYTGEVTRKKGKTLFIPDGEKNGSFTLDRPEPRYSGQGL